MANYDKLDLAIDNPTAAPIGQYDEPLKERVPAALIEVGSKENQMFGVRISTKSVAYSCLVKLTGRIVYSLHE